MGFFSDVTGGSLLNLGGSLAGAFLGGNRVRSPQRVPIGKLVAEAKAAGLHPLAALGHSPTVIPGYNVGESTAGRVSRAMADFGQDLSRAEAARQTQPQRELQMLQLEQAKLSNAALRQQILQGQDIHKRRIRDMDRTPATPTPRNPVLPTGDAVRASEGTTEIIPGQMVHPVRPGIESGGLSKHRYLVDREGVSVAPSQEYGEMQEESMGGKAEGLSDVFKHTYLRVRTQFGSNAAYKEVMGMAPPVTSQMKRAGVVWRYNPATNRFVTVKVGSRQWHWYKKHYNY